MSGVFVVSQWGHSWHCEDGARDAALHLQCLGQPSTENDLASCQSGGETLVESFGPGWEARVVGWECR